MHQLILALSLVMFLAACGTSQPPNSKVILGDYNSNRDTFTGCQVLAAKGREKPAEMNRCYEIVGAHDVKLRVPAGGCFVYEGKSDQGMPRYRVRRCQDMAPGRCVTDLGGNNVVAVYSKPCR